MTLARPIAQPLAKALARGLAQRGAGGTASYLRRLFASTPALRDDGISVIDSSATGTYRPRQPGRCLEFDGLTQKVEIDHDLGVSGSDPRTYTCWGKGINILFFTHGGSLGTGNKVQVHEVASKIRLELGGSSYVTTGLTLKNSEWNFLAITLDGTTLADFRIFLNGEWEDATGTATVNTTDGLLTLATVNWGDGGGGSYGDCALSDARIYNRVLTDDEIKALYWQGLQPDRIVPGQPDATNLVGQWLLNDNSTETAYDSSGNGNHGTIIDGDAGILYEGDDVPCNQQNLIGYSDGASSTYVPADASDPTNDVLGNPLQYSGPAPVDGRLENGPCLTFDGTDQYVDCGDDPAFDLTTALSVSVWAKHSDADIFSFSDIVLSKWGTTANKREWALAFTSDEKLAVFLSSDGLFNNQWTSDDPITINEWNHLAFSYDGISLSVYLNGVELPGAFSSGSLPSSLFNGNHPVEVGSINGGSNFFPGGIFDTRIYDYALTPEQVNDLPDDPIFWLPMSEGDGDTVYDVIGGDSYTITNYAADMWTANTQDQFFYNVERGCGECPDFQDADLQDQDEWLIQNDGWAVSGGKAVRTDDGDNYLNIGQEYPVIGGITYLISWNQSLTGGSAQISPATRVFCADSIAGTTQLGSVSTGGGNKSTSIVLTGGGVVGLRSRGGTTINSVSIQAVDSVFILALADGSADANGNPIIGTANTLNNADCNLNLRPEPNDPIVRSYLPGATFDGVGDCAWVPGVFWDNEADWELDIVCVLPDDVSQGVVGNYTGGNEFGIIVYNFAGQKNALSIRLGGFASGVTNFILPFDVYVPDEQTTINVKFFAATGLVVATVNGTEYQQVLSAPTNNLRTEAHRQLTLATRKLTTLDSNLDGQISYFKFTGSSGTCEFNLQRNYGTHIPDLSGNGNHGTLVVNSSLAEIFAPELPPTDYTQGDGLSRPHFVDVDAAGNESNFRTEIE
jgi:hypothetical protein